ncbi:MAG: hypothetical protein JSR98_04535 [Proteobacteria bacterium]|nr:hypothetical protein [Pseudomonadota bacterium]
MGLSGIGLTALGLAVALGGALPAASQPQAGPKVFVLGVWMQSTGQMDDWKARGVNTLVEVPQGNDVAGWSQAADQRGFYQIRHPSSDLIADLGDRRLLAWATQDEPSNVVKGKFDYGGVAQDPAEVVREAAPWRAAAKAAGKTLPIWTNHVGPHIYPDWAQKSVLMQDYMKGPASDWLAADSYPVEEKRPVVIRSNDGYTSTTQGVVIDRQLAWSGGKPVMAFIGTAAFGDQTPVPTPEEFRVMAWSSVIHGAIGIIYFPIRLSPSFTFDATPPQLVRALTEFDRQAAGLQDVLVDTAAGGRRPFTLWRSADEGAAPAAGQLPYPFEASEIPTAKGPFRIVLNLSDRPQTLDRPAWGLSHTVFQPYEVKMAYGSQP